MNRFVLPLAALLPCFPSIATAQWSDNFDSYAPNSSLTTPAQGGWEEWSAGSGALVSNARARSGTNSVDIVGPTDLVHQYTGITTGKWVYQAWQYIPSTMVGTTYFILLNTYAFPAGPYSWSVQVAFSVAGGVRANLGIGTVGHAATPVIPDTWVEIKVLIDLDQDWCQFYYNGVLLDEPGLPDHGSLGGGYQWSRAVFGQGGGQVRIAAVDLYANSATSAFYDDLSLHQARFESFGTGCAGAMPAPVFSPIMLPMIGQPYLQQINNLPTSAAFHILGFDNQTSALGPLPLNLSFVGAPGCFLRVRPDSSIFLGGSQNSAVFSLSIPNQSSLVGMKFYEQAAALDPTANALGATISPMYGLWIQ
jgi:hypothetical protein